MKRLSLLLVLSAAAACVKQGPMRETTPLTPARDVCSDSELEAVCAPSPASAPTRVDTNLRASSPTANLG